MNDIERIQNSLNMLYGKVESARASGKYPTLLRLLATQALLKMRISPADGREELSAVAYQMIQFYNNFTPDTNLEARIILLGLPSHAAEVSARMNDEAGAKLSQLSKVNDVVYATTYNLALLLGSGRDIKQDQLLPIRGNRTNIALALLGCETSKLKNQVRRDLQALNNLLEGPYFEQPEHWAPLFSLLMAEAGKRVGCGLTLPAPWSDLLG